LNANCKAIGGCDASSAQVQWLVADLKADHQSCTLAFWHQPRFSSGAVHHSDPTYDAFWRALYAAHADLVLTGHDHDYERFAPQTPDAASDPTSGITEFVVGTGGRSHYQIGKLEPNSQATKAGVYGILAVTLHPESFDWRFIPEPGQTFTDSGSQPCHMGAARG
ncbi:MAG: alkaline phosphatase, partial [Candidatus Eremiobacteraeota bacterium]|nr:alkaline phosphatase [Candidatus Eremiobacteraeota bacterium]